VNTVIVLTLFWIVVCIGCYDQGKKDGMKAEKNAHRQMNEFDND
jgi:hypothetical protein